MVRCTRVNDTLFAFKIQIEGRTMPDALVSPVDLVDALLNPGLSTSVGSIPLSQYMSGSDSNGGNDSALSLLTQIRFMTDGESKGPPLNAIVGPVEYDIAMKGQGSPAAFVKIMNFIVKNKEKIKPLTIELAHRVAPTDGTKVWPKMVDWTGKVSQRYFMGSDMDTLKKMVADKIFGYDCVGFVANYLVAAGLWKSYQSYEIYQYPTVFPTRITSYADVTSLCILKWGKSHIAIIDSWVADDAAKKSVTVNVCQSSENGPQINKGVELTEAGGTFLISTSKPGTPKMPVGGYVEIYQMPNLRRIRPVVPATVHPTTDVPFPVKH